MWEEAIKDCSIILGTSSFHQRPMEHAVIELPNLNKYLSDYNAADPLALVFGSERSGMSNGRAFALPSHLENSYRARGPVDESRTGRQHRAL